MNFDNHFTIQFAKVFLELAQQNKISVQLADTTLLSHVMRGHITDYGIIKLVNDILVKYKDMLDAHGVEYLSLEQADAVVRPTNNKIEVKIVGNNNVIEIRFPFLIKKHFDPLTSFLKESGYEYERRNDSDPVWFQVIRDEDIFDELLDHEVMKEVGYTIDETKQRRAIAKIKKDIIEHKKLFKLSAQAKIEETEEFKGMFKLLYPFQQVTIEYSKHKNRIFIADEMGLGKTIEGLAVMEYHQAYPAVIVVPAMIKKNWGREISKWLPHRKLIVAEGDIMPKGDIYVISYNMVTRLGARLMMRKPKLVLLDESHYIKNPDAQRTVSIKESFKKVDFKILMTGTPILNRTVELVSQLAFLDVLYPHFGGKRKFIKRYSPVSFTGYRKVYGSENTEELQLELRKSCMIRRMKKDVHKEIPDKIKQVIFLPLSDVKAYKKVEEDSINWYEHQLQQKNLTDDQIEKMVHDKLVNRSEYAEKMVKVEYLKQAAVNYKLKAVFEWVDDALEQLDKIILFAHHRNVVERLHEQYKDKSVILYGGMSSQVDTVVDRFVNDKNIKIFIGSIQSAGIGIDGLQKVAANIAFVELGWTPAIHLQAEDRVHRIGQTLPVNIYYLLGEDTIEEYIYKMVLEKEEIFEGTTNIDRIFKMIARRWGKNV